jgi:hypothetical protein
MFQVSGLDYVRGSLFMNEPLLANTEQVGEYIGTVLAEQKMMAAGIDGIVRSINAFGQYGKTDAAAKKTNPNHGKGKHKFVHKAEKKGKKYDPLVKKFDPKKPGQHLTKHAWFALTDDQKTAFKDARRAVEEAKEAAGNEGTVSLWAITTICDEDDDFVMEDVDASCAVAAVKCTLKPAPKPAFEEAFGVPHKHVSVWWIQACHLS